MLRRIIRIDEEKCNGCGACASACHEGAIGIIDGKARLLRENYCDGLGDCLPTCPMDAISFEVREAPAYDEAAVLAAKAKKNAPMHSGCPGSRAAMLKNRMENGEMVSSQSRLMQWPVQIKLVPVNAQYFDGADLLIAADCTAYAYGGFHEKLMKGKITLIGCPKLDDVDYSQKLTQIIAQNDIKSVTVARMEVPCCSGIENAAKRAVAASGRILPVRVVTISTDGNILEDSEF